MKSDMVVSIIIIKFRLILPITILKKYKRLVAGLDLKNMYYGVCVYEEKLSDDALVEILHYPMIRKVERDHGKK